MVPSNRNTIVCIVSTAHISLIGANVVTVYASMLLNRIEEANLAYHELKFDIPDAKHFFHNFPQSIASSVKCITQF